MQALAENIYYETNYAGVVVGAVTLPQGTLIIDAPLRSEDARAWKAALLTQSRGTHRLLVILDIHADRTLGTRAIEFPIIAQEETAAAYGERTAVFKGQNLETGAEWEHYPEVNGTRWELPSITFKEQLSLHWGDQEIIIEHHPGPTSGSSWVHIPDERIVFVGDAVALNQPPILARANLDDWHETLNHLASRTFTEYTIVSGRSGLVTIDDVREQRKFLQSIHGRLKTLAKRKASPEETHKMIPALLDKLSIPTKLTSFYTQRLEFGLLQYYSRHFS